MLDDDRRTVARLRQARADDLHHLATIKTLYNGLGVSLETDIPPAREQLEQLRVYLRFLGRFLEDEIADIDTMLAHLQKPQPSPSPRPDA